MTMVFVEQPLALPGSANNNNKNNGLSCQHRMESLQKRNINQLIACFIEILKVLVFFTTGISMLFLSLLAWELYPALDPLLPVLHRLFHRANAGRQHHLQAPPVLPLARHHVLLSLLDNPHQVPESVNFLPDHQGWPPVGRQNISTCSRSRTERPGTGAGSA